MNHIYRLVWCRSRHVMVVASELSSSRLRIGKSASARASLARPGTMLRLLSIVCIGVGSIVHATAAHAQSSSDGKLGDLQSLVSKYDRTPVVGSQPEAVSATEANVVGAPVTVVRKLGSGLSDTVSVTHQIASAALAATSKLPAVSAASAGPVVQAVASGLNGAVVASNQQVASAVGTVAKLPVAGMALSDVGAVVKSVAAVVPVAHAAVSVSASTSGVVATSGGQSAVLDVAGSTALAAHARRVSPAGFGEIVGAADTHVTLTRHTTPAQIAGLAADADVAATVQLKLPATTLPVATTLTSAIGTVTQAAGGTGQALASTLTGLGSVAGVAGSGQPAGVLPLTVSASGAADRRKNSVSDAAASNTPSLVDTGDDPNPPSSAEQPAALTTSNAASSVLPTAFTASSQPLSATIAALTPSSIAAALPASVPVLPPPSPTPTGLIVGNGGLVGASSQLLGTTENSLFSNSSGYVSNGSLRVDSANFSQGYSTVSLLGVPVLNLTPVGTVLTTTGGTVLGGTGVDSHLTLIGGVTSNSYIDNINNGAAGGLLGLALPNQAPAWASTCLNVLGVVKESCWAVNAAQDNQVLMGDGATANGSEEVVIGTNASHTLAAVDACTAFPGGSTNDPNNPCGVPTADYAAREGHSVVIGDSASGTANAQTILGANATSNAANSVALGYASVADRGAQANYTAFGLSALQNSAGEVSIGAPGQERQISNVAAGSAATDAVNVAQLEGVAATADNAVLYDDASKAVVTLTSPTSTDGGVTHGSTITNLHQGNLSATSTDAVNGAQLYATNSNVSTIYNTGVKYMQTVGVGVGSVASGANSIAAGPLAVATGASSIAMGNGAQANSDASVAIGNGASALSGSAVSIGSGNSASGNGAIAMGDPNTATGQGAVALGYNNFAVGQGSIAMGSTSAANGASAIALGDTANATQANAIAIGAGANANLLNSVALGAGSVTQVGALTNYTAYGLTTPQTSSGEVNVGNRQITGVAAGSTANDVVNLAQLEGVAAVASNAVQYDDPSKATVTLAGPTSSDGGVTNGTTITNLHQGNLSATSTDAVNGAQLYATNNSIANIYDTGTKYFHANSTGPDSSATGTDSVAIGTGAVASSADDVALGAGSVTAAPHTGATALFGGTSAGTAAAVLSIGAAGQERQIQNVAPGVLATSSTDAVNGSQLYAVATGVNNLGTSVATSLGGSSTYNSATGAVTTSLSYGGGSYSSVQNVLNALTGGGPAQGIKYFHVNSTLTDAAASGTDSVAIGPLANAGGSSSVALGNGAAAAGNNALAFGAGASASMDNSIALGAGSATQVGALSNYSAIGLTAPQTSSGEVNVGNRQITGVAAGSASGDAVNVAQLEGVSNQVTAASKLSVKYDADSSGNPTNTVSLVGDGSGAQVGITNLAAGAEGASSTDAVNGSQLWHWTQDSTNIYSNYSLYNDFKSINTSGGGGSPYFSVNSTLGAANATGSNSIAVGPTAQASGSSSVAIGNGANASADNAVALGAGSVADRANSVSVGSAGNERQITNVAAGTEGTDAVNLGQMDSAITASSQGSVHYDTNTDGSINYGSVTLGNGSGDTTIHNVAAGTATTDAVNVGQLNNGIQQAVNWADAYTDQKFNAINQQIQQVGNRANAGVAAAMAMAGLPQAYEPGKSMAAMSAGTFRGESSMAIGLSMITEGGRWVYRLTASGDTRGDAGASVGVGMQW